MDLIEFELRTYIRTWRFYDSDLDVTPFTKQEGEAIWTEGITHTRCSGGRKAYGYMDNGMILCNACGQRLYFHNWISNQ